jgi:hypothetical protein
MRRLFLALVLATPAAAQEAAPPATGEAPGTRLFQVPAGCTAYLTVQQASCTVSHHYTCEGDPEGWQRRAEMDERGVAYAGAIDGETQWIESLHFLSDHSETLAPNPADPASFSELLATGRDSFDFVTDSPEIGPTRYAGSDRLTGESVTIDGVTLDRTEFQLVATDATGAEVWRTAGNEYISRDWRMFLAGTSATQLPDGSTYEDDSSPVEFIRPGEEGFLSVRPRHGCGQLMSKRAG